MLEIKTLVLVKIFAPSSETWYDGTRVGEKRRQLWIRSWRCFSHTIININRNITRLVHQLSEDNPFKLVSAKRDDIKVSNEIRIQKKEAPQKMELAVSEFEALWKEIISNHGRFSGQLLRLQIKWVSYHWAKSKF